MENTLQNSIKPSWLKIKTKSKIKVKLKKKKNKKTKTKTTHHRPKTNFLVIIKLYY